MPIRVGLMGFGRIGRNIFRILHERRDIQIVAIAEIVPPATIEYLLRYDTVHGPFEDLVKVEHNALFAGGREITLFDAVEPGEADWTSVGADIVIEATTKYRQRHWLEKHLSAGAKKVILTVPPAEGEKIDTVVMGVNDEKINELTTLVSNGSVTVNCVAPLLKILHDAYGIRWASMTSVHAYTNAQRLADVPSSDFRASRSAAENIIPTRTGSPHFIGSVLPELEGKLQGIAMNVPVPDGSVVDLVTEMENPVSVTQINGVIESAVGSRQYRDIVQYVTDPIVSSDVIGNTHSAIFDSLSTKVLGETLVKTLCWYDNGWGYACRVVEMIERLGQELHS